MRANQPTDDTMTQLAAERLLDLIAEFSEAADGDAACLAFLACVSATIRATARPVPMQP